MIDLKNAYEIRNVLNDKVIDKIEEKQTGKIWYEAWKKLPASGTLPLTLNKCKGVDLVNYKIYGKSVQGRLPQEYQQVEYIEGTGTQYIDTGMKLNQNSKVELEIQITDSGNHKIFGSRTSAAENNFGIISSSNYMDFILDFQNHILNRFATSYNTYKKKCIISNKLLQVGGMTKSVDDYTDFTTPDNAYIFNMSGNSPDLFEPAKMKLYYCKIYDDNVLVRNFIPCYRKSDNEIGLYDTVDGIFYTNSGTGTFLKGDNTPTPEVPIEIESVGEKTKNLFDINKALDPTNYVQTSYGYYGLPIKVEIGKTYTFNRNNTNGYGLNLGNIGFKNSVDDSMRGWMVHTTSEGLNNSIYTFTATTNVIYFCTNVRTESKLKQLFDAVLKDAQLEKGSTAADYEPYGYKIPLKASNGIEEIATNIYLNEPLRKIRYYADYIDFENGKVIRNVQEKNFNGSESWQQASSMSTRFLLYNINDLKKDSSSNSRINIMSNYFEAISWENRNLITTNSIYTYVLGLTTAIAITNNNTNTVSDFKEWLSVNNVKTYYPLETPIEEDIELPNIPTYKGTTILEVDTTIQPSNTKVVYMGKP